MSDEVQLKKAHSPWLVNCMVGCPHHKAVWTLGILQDVRLHDFVKLLLYHPLLTEAIWVEVCMKSKAYWVGQVHSKTAFHEKLKVGDLLKFHPVNVYAITKAAETPLE